jgi:coenzyme F420-0:L-glutamate ligase/coenzyme F420-1:gamma-L-glutamate ligase
MSQAVLTVIGLPGLPLVRKGDDLGRLIHEAAVRSRIQLLDGDILVVSQTVVSRAEGSVVRLDDVVPSAAALKYATITGKDPRVVEVVLRQSRRVVLARRGFMVCETLKGFVCANAGVDASNNEAGYVSTLPEDPDRSARCIAASIKVRCGVDVAVIISDSEGRPFRKGAIGVAVGVSGISPIRSFIGIPDLFGRKLETTLVCTADMVCSAAALIMGEAAEGLPVVIVRGLEYDREGKISDVLYEEDAFMQELEGRRID